MTRASRYRLTTKLKVTFPPECISELFFSMAREAYTNESRDLSRRYLVEIFLKYNTGTSVF